MNGAHFHLLVNHLPIIFPIVGLIILLLGVFFKSEPIKRSAWFIFILGSLGSVAAMASGEGAEEIIENLNTISKNTIHQHEELAEIFALTSYVLGIISIAGIWLSLKQHKLNFLTAILTIVLSLVALFFATKTGTSGGEIRHTEIQSGFPTKSGENGKIDTDD